MTRLTEEQCDKKIKIYRDKCLKYDCCTISPDLNLTEFERKALESWLFDYNDLCRDFEYNRYAQGVWASNEYIAHANSSREYMNEVDYKARGMEYALRSFGFDTVSAGRDDDGLLSFEEIVRFALDDDHTAIHYTDKNLENLFNDMVDSLVDALDEHQYVRI